MDEKRIRKIENGFIVSHSKITKNGYETKEKFHPTDPMTKGRAKAKAAPSGKVGGMSRGDLKTAISKTMAKRP